MSTTSSPRQAHNLTQQELADLKQQQISGEELPTVTGNGTEKGYQIPKHEAHLVHVKIESGRYDPITGELKGPRPLIQTFSPADYKKMKDERAFDGKKVTVLHNGGAPIEGVEPKDALVGTIVSQPGAGLPIALDYSKMSLPKLKKVYADLNPEDKNPPTEKPDLIEAITARNLFLKDEAYRQNVEGIDKNRLGADAEAKEEGALKSATADVRPDVPGAAVVDTPPATGTEGQQPAQQGNAQQGNLLDTGEEPVGF